MSALIAYGDRLLSLFKTATASIGTEESEAPLERLTNGMLGQNVGFAETTAAGAVDLLTSQAPDFAAVFSHNLSGATVRVQGSDLADFSVLIVNQLMTVASPHFAIDLRAVTPRTARYWRLHVASNAYAVRIGEFHVFTATALRNHRWDYTDGHVYLHYVLGDSDFGAYEREELGAKIRYRKASFWGPRDMAEVIRAVSRFAMAWPGPVVFIPDETNMADVWFLDWSDELAKVTDVDNFYQFELGLIEHSPGVLLPAF